jgi:hypothetical protein
LSDPSDINEDTVRALATAADLPLGPEREAMVAAQLREWLTAANELNRKMSAAEHWTAVPVTVFAHPDLPGGEE